MSESQSIWPEGVEGELTKAVKVEPLVKVRKPKLTPGNTLPSKKQEARRALFSAEIPEVIKIPVGTALRTGPFSEDDSTEAGILEWASTEETIAHRLGEIPTIRNGHAFFNIRRATLPENEPQMPSVWIAKRRLVDSETGLVTNGYEPRLATYPLRALHTPSRPHTTRKNK